MASGATAAFNVGGTGEFTSANIATLAALGTSSGGFANGSFIGLDTTNASGGNFTYAGVIANTNGGANVIGLSKLGTGALTLTGANTYSGGTLHAVRRVPDRESTIKAGNNAAFGTGTITLAGGILDVGGFTLANAIYLPIGNYATVTGSEHALRSDNLFRRALSRVRRGHADAEQHHQQFHPARSSSTAAL